MTANHRFPFQMFRSNDNAILDLPFYLLVTIIIGLLVIIGIFSMMIIPSFISSEPVLSISPMITTTNSRNTSINYSILLQTKDNQAISQAHIIIRNEFVIATNVTNATGQTIIPVEISIPEGLYEAYLDVIIKSNTNPTITRKDMLKVVLRG